MNSPYSERQSLLSPGGDVAPTRTCRRRLYDLLEANNKAGMLLEAITVLLIVVNVVCFLLSTEESLADNTTAWRVFDSVELCTVALFTTEYILRFYSIVEATDSNGKPLYPGPMGRLVWAATDFYSWVDLASIVPYYVDLAVTEDLPATQFIRLARMLRMMKEGGFGEAFDTFGDIFRKNKTIVTTSVFVGLTTWLMLSSFNYIAERNNPDMVWVYPSCYADEEDGGDGGPREGRPDCPHRYGSILSASYFTLLNLFGEFPLMDNHNTAGRFVGVFTAVVAVAVFAIPTGIFGSGFEDMIQHRKKQQQEGKQREEEQSQQSQQQQQEQQQEAHMLKVSISSASSIDDDHTIDSAMDNAKSGFFRSGSSAGAYNSSAISSGVYGDDSGGGGGGGGDSGLPMAWVGKGGGGGGDEAGFAFLDTRTKSGKAYRTLVLAVVVLDILAFFASTTFFLQDGQLFGAGVALGALEIVSVTFLTADYAARVLSAAAADDSGHGVMRYVMSFYGAVDLLSVLPFFLGLPAVGGLRNLSTALLPTIVRSCRLIRMLKLERYVRAFEVFDDAIRDQRDILAVSGFFALVAWVFASSLLYYTERAGPDPSTTPYYQSVPMAMWVTMLNLAGEAPLCDYTAWGKVITGALGIFGVGVFAVPVGLLGAGFQEYVETIPDKEDAIVKATPNSTLPMRAAGLSTGSGNDTEYSDERSSPGGTRQKPFRKRVYAFLEARTPWGRRFEAFIMLVIFVTVTQAIVMTMPSVCADETHCPPVLDTIELVAVVIFTLEYAARVYAAPESYPDKSPCVARLRYMVSFYAVIDFLAVFPYYLAQASARVDEYDNYLRLLRLLRILKLDKYAPCVSLIDDVFRLKARGLLVAGYASAVMLAWFGSLMYLAERDDEAVKIDCFFESQRFASVLNSLQYDLILLTGDYPIVDFSLLGRYINFVQIFVAVGVVAVPSGLIANGFSQVLEESRNAKHAKRRAAAVLLQKQVRGHLARRQFMMLVDDVQQQEDERQRQERLRKKNYEEHLPVYDRTMRVCYRFSTGITEAGKLFDTFVAALIVLNVVAVIAESEPFFGGGTGPSREGGFQEFFDSFEAFSVVVFTAEISMRLFIAPISSKYSFSRWTYISSFFGLVDIASIAPWYIETALSSSGIYFDASTFRVLRLFRILQLEHFVSAFSLLDDVWTQSKDTLAATGLLALVVWVGSACLFYLFEKDNGCTGEAFSSIPDAMFYTAIFLGGEWAEIDFTWPGKVLCCVLCVFGIVLFGIPVGTVFEAFQDVMQEVNAEDEEDEDVKHEATGADDSMGGSYGIQIGPSRA